MRRNIAEIYEMSLQKSEKQIEMYARTETTQNTRRKTATSGCDNKQNNCNESFKRDNRNFISCLPEHSNLLLFMFVFFARPIRIAAICSTCMPSFIWAYPLAASSAFRLLPWNFNIINLLVISSDLGRRFLRSFNANVWECRFRTGSRKYAFKHFLFTAWLDWWIRGWRLDPGFVWSQHMPTIRWKFR